MSTTPAALVFVFYWRRTHALAGAADLSLDVLSRKGSPAGARHAGTRGDCVGVSPMRVSILTQSCCWLGFKIVGTGEGSMGGGKRRDLHATLSHLRVTMRSKF